MSEPRKIFIPAGPGHDPKKVAEQMIAALREQIAEHRADEEVSPTLPPETDEGRHEEEGST